MVSIDKKESDFLNSVKFICILTIVMVHCSLHDSQYIAPQLTQDAIPNLKSWYVSLHFGETALRLFFIISGYLFFRSATLESFDWKRDYLTKLKSRSKSLLVLYIVWNTIGLAVNYLVHKTYPPDFLSLLDGYNPFSDTNYFGKGLWFLETLIVFTFISPIYYVAIRYLKHLIPLLCLVFHFTSINIDNLYFNMYLLLGSYFACCGFRITDIANLFNWKICLPLILLIQVFHKSGIIQIPISIPLTTFLFLSTFMGILYRHPIPSKIAESSTFVYVSHFYFTLTLKRILLTILPSNLFGYVSNMVLNCVISSFICVTIYVFFISRYNILNLIFAGGRSIKKGSDMQNK